MRLVVVVVIAACGGHPPAHQDPAPRKTDAGVPSTADARSEREMAGVQLTVTPPDAEVVIDRISFGVVSMRVIPLDPGLHQLVVQLAGYKPFRVELTVANKIEHLTVRLEPIPQPGD